MSNTLNTNACTTNAAEMYSTGSETVAWLLDHKWLVMPTLIGFLMFLSLLTIFVVIRFIRLEAHFEQTLGDVAARLGHGT